MATIPAVRPVDPAESGQVVDDLHAAFLDDPVVAWAFPALARRRRYARHFFAMHARRLVPGGLAWRTDGGAALWAAPGAWRESAADQARLVLATAPGLRPLHGLRVGRGLFGVERRHPEEPHAYLATVGVRPDRRGQGLGTGLLEPGLRWADERRLPCYLESSNPRNLTLYERAGFRTTGVLQLPRGPQMTLMWRPAC